MVLPMFFFITCCAVLLLILLGLRAIPPRMDVKHCSYHPKVYKRRVCNLAVYERGKSAYNIKFLLLVYIVCFKLHYVILQQGYRTEVEACHHV